MIKATECLFYKYKVLWYDPDSTTGEHFEETGIVIGKSYSDACSHLAKLYDDDLLGYIHLVCISNDSSTPVMTAEELKDYGIEVKNNE